MRVLDGWRLGTVWSPGVHIAGREILAVGVVSGVPQSWGTPFLF